MANGNVNWQDLGWTGQAAGSTGLQDLLGDFFADPAAQMKFFEDYDPSKEQAATQQMQMEQEAAQQQAQSSMWQQFEAGRQGKGGFGGAGRARQAAMGGIHKGLAQGREQAQLGLQQDISGLREAYRGDVLGQVGSLLASGVEAGMAADNVGITSNTQQEYTGSDATGLGFSGPIELDFDPDAFNFNLDFSNVDMNLICSNQGLQWNAETNSCQ